MCTRLSSTTIRIKTALATTIFSDTAVRDHRLQQQSGNTGKAISSVTTYKRYWSIFLCKRKLYVWEISYTKKSHIKVGWP